MNTQNPVFPWYDSYWLASYVACKSYISENRPEFLKEFEKAFELFRVDPTFKPIELDAVFSDEDLAALKAHLATLQAKEYKKYEFFDFGRIIRHNDPFVTTLQEKLCNSVSELLGEEVEISYNFLSLYNSMGVLNPHMDAGSAKWTLDFCIDQSDVWPIQLSKVLPWPEDFEATENWIEDIKKNPENEFKTYELVPGKALLFAGNSQWHYREPLVQTSKKGFCHLAFFHFIPKGSRALIYIKNWAAHFGIPELNDLIYFDDGN